jgi:hypothetical protein
MAELSGEGQHEALPDPAHLRRRFPEYRPLLVGDPPGQLAAERAGIAWVSWRDFLLSGPPSRE